jgi:hypothetical protein
MQNELKHELHLVLSGKSQIRFGTTIQAIASYLDHGAQTSSIVKNEKQYRNQETKSLEKYISENPKPFSRRELGDMNYILDERQKDER